MTSSNGDAVQTPAIPIIDIERKKGQLPPASVVRAVDAACSGPGFIVIVGHGVADDVVNPMVDTTRQFFLQDAAIKDTYRIAPELRDLHVNNKFRGYNGGYSLVGGPPDHIEGFQMSRFESRAAMLEAGSPPEFAEGFADNIWPTWPQDFKPVWQRYFYEVKNLGDYLLEIAALALDLPHDWFAPKFSRQSSYVVANYYAAKDGPPPEGGQRLHPHTDYGAFTILMQDTAIGGLEVEFRGGDWERVPYLPGSFVVNLGDLLAKWTNDRWVATPHKVRIPERDEYGHDRISIPYFQHPNLDALIETIPTCIEPGDPVRHEPVLWRDWGSLRINQLSRAD